MGEKLPERSRRTRRVNELAESVETASADIAAHVAATSTVHGLAGGAYVQGAVGPGHHCESGAIGRLAYHATQTITFAKAFAQAPGFATVVVYGGNNGDMKLVSISATQAVVENTDSVTVAGAWIAEGAD